MKRFVGLTLAFLLLFNLFGCQWLLPEDGTPDTNEPEDSLGENKPQEPTDENSKPELEEGLIKALSDYLRECYGPECDLAVRSLEEKINYCRNGYNPLLVEGGEECYYVAVYSNQEPSPTDENRKFEEHTWVRFNTSEEISESWNDEAFLAAFQINPARSCKNLKTGETDIKMEHFFHIRPEFKDGFAIPIKKTNQILFIQLTTSDEKQLYCTSSSAIQWLYQINCAELDGETYIYYQIGYRLGNGKYVEHDLEAEFGEYYDEIMKVMTFKEYTSGAEVIKKDGYISINDFSNIIQD